MKTRTGKHFDEIFFEEDLTILFRYYQDAGFNQARISKHEKRFSDDKTELMLDITIDEVHSLSLGNIRSNSRTLRNPRFLKRRFVIC